MEDVFDYKHELDILKVEKNDYDSYISSTEFANFVVDFSENGDVLGVEIIGAKEALPLSKEELKNISEINCFTDRNEEFLKISVEIYIDGNKNIVSSNFPVNSGLQA